MSKKPFIDRQEIERATSSRAISESLSGDRTMILLALFGAILSAGLLVYFALGTERIEQVYLNQDLLDTPTLLPKVRNSQNEVSNDRWVRGFIRRFLSFHFVRPDDSREFVDKAVAWQHAHSANAGRLRAEAIHRERDTYENQRKILWVAFWVKNEPEAVKISTSKDDPTKIFAEMPGTFWVHNQKGDAIYDAKLRLVLRKVPVSGRPSALGTINLMGLEVVEGYVDYTEDYTRRGEKTSWSVFSQVGG